MNREEVLQRWGYSPMDLWLYHPRQTECLGCWQWFPTPEIMFAEHKSAEGDCIVIRDREKA